MTRLICKSRLSAALLASTAFAALAIAPAARATDGFGSVVSPGFPYSFGISPNGNVLFGYAANGDAGGLAMGWILKDGTYTWVPLLEPGQSTGPVAINNDGSVWVGGGSYSNGSNHMVRFENGVLTDLHTGPAFASGGPLAGYNTSVAAGMSADTNVIAGYAWGSGVNQAVRWTQATGIVGLGFLPGYTDSVANAISADGRTIVGYAANGFQGFTEAAYWSQRSGTWTGLGTLPGGNDPTYAGSNAVAVSADGSVIVGSSTVSAGDQHAFRWTRATGMRDLGILQGQVSSHASAVSADGSVVVGSSTGGMSLQAWRAFRWTEATGMQSLADALTGRPGLDLGGWTLHTATGLSADGNIVIGEGTDPNGSLSYYIARCQSAICLGLMTLEQLSNSYAGQSAVGQTANAAIGGSLSTMQEQATQARASQGSRSTPYSVFAYGAYDTDPVTSGTLGITVDVTRDIVVGLAASAARVETEMIYDGSADMRGGGLSAFVAHVPDTGLQWLTGINGLFIDGDIERGYMNGVGRGFSRGSSSSDGFGFIGRVGWTEQFGPLQLTPFASYTFSQSTLDAYTEEDGVFASSFEKMTSTAETARFGADARYTFRPDTWVWGTLAWGHRLDGGKSPDVTATLGNWFPMTVAGVAAIDEWLEVGGGVRLPAWDNGAVTASVTATLPEDDGDITYLARAGLSQDF